MGSSRVAWELFREILDRMHPAVVNAKAARRLALSGKGMGKEPVVARASLTSCLEGSEHLVAEIKQFS